MKNTLETRLGMFIALAMIAGFLILQVIGDLNFFKPAFHIHALFNSIQELKVGDPVKMAGVPIGKIEKIGISEKENKVEVLLRLSKDAPVRTDSTATIKFAGLM